MAIVKLNSIDEKSNIPEIICVEYTFKYAKIFLIDIPKEIKKLNNYFLLKKILALFYYLIQKLDIQDQN